MRGEGHDPRTTAWCHVTENIPLDIPTTSETPSLLDLEVYRENVASVYLGVPGVLLWGWSFVAGIH